MGRDLWVLAFVACGVFFLPYVDDAEGPPMAPAVVQARVAALAPHVEAVIGRSLGAPVRAKVVSNDEMAEVLAHESIDIFGVPPQLARAQSKFLAPLLLGKVSIHDGTLYFLPQNLEKLARIVDVPIDADLRDAVLLHELVHVHHVRHLGLEEFFRAGLSPGRAAVCEGYAQFVARRAAERAGVARGLENMVRIQTTVPDVIEDGAARNLLESFTSLTAFPYVQGERLVAHVMGERGWKEGRALLLDTPPDSVEDITFPERAYAPPRADSARFATACDRIERWLEERGAGVRRQDLVAPGELHRNDTWSAVRFTTDDRMYVTVYRFDDEEGAKRFGSRTGRAWDRAIGLIATGTYPSEAARLTTLAHALVAAVDRDSPWTGLDREAALDACAAAAAGHADWSVRWRAVRNLARARPQSPAIDEALKDGDARVRAAAVRALRSRWDAELRTRVGDDEDWEVQRLLDG